MRSEHENVDLHLKYNTAGKPPATPDSGYEAELAEETRNLRWLHALLDAELADADGFARGAAAERAGEQLSARWEREVSVQRWSERARALTAARAGLCFGRLDPAGAAGGPGAPAPTRAGRIGLTDPGDGESALVDWRAPAARPFYCATPVTPLGVGRRRHYTVAGTAPQERVVAFHDDLLDIDIGTGTGTEGAAAGPVTVSASDPALLAALTAPRGTRMCDIVTTIQSEQDEIIRLPLSGTVVIEGGPGTGKTAVALHRIAYLLYTHRERLARSGVLVVGPSAGFVHYVGGVLPALGESAVVFTTPGRLAHGVVAEATDPPGTARLKGDLTMVDVLRRAVDDRQQLPGAPVAIEMDDVTVEIDTALAAEARRRARATGRPHNTARATFRDTLGRLLVDQGLERLEVGLEDPPELAELLAGLDIPEIEPAGAAEVSAEMRAELRDAVRTDPRFHDAVEALWPVLTPRRALTELYADLDRLASAGAGEDLSALHRAPGAPWTVADAPLLDELAELLGPVPGSAPAAAAEPDSAYAAEVLTVLESADRSLAGEDPDELRPTDFVTADMLARRHVAGVPLTVAERAAADRDWRYGHLVVDEAQELSAMDWHVLLRRCPARSITAVGDLAQRSAPAGARAWDDVLAPHLAGRWTHRTLTVNYRTPSEIMDAAARVLATYAPDRRPPESVRSTGEPPRTHTVPAGELAAAVRRIVDDERARTPGGTVTVIAPPGTDAGSPGVPVHTPVSAKGLEFDAVVIVDPERIRATDPADLYVAMTRATQRLTILEVTG
ncbi:UvrD-helicase domain-containing protein [Pseudonocardia sp. ICBG1293]|uniref:UvrD-helicase domain-containing protein n=1 Tax=Pseudonocardia sp. ICBG1293 TaxID=2844382 RepID=UPI0027E1CDA8|nr:UvrD-helicase domain-containing protein [Pseudonocardia sp. ICBG1293]